ncbi:leucine-rich repeat-containing protein 74B-like [Equus quagga]|uniref:leucine-rich repeat-containing protein 74B-like n=1 Tax=Equus quagga TaxID=89248 RepID=UPI001EE1AAA3|nr:leucine-rich repeat-containing protein 74B-like [Equus quagga]
MVMAEPRGGAKESFRKKGSWHRRLGVLLKDTLSLRSPQAHSVMPASWFLCQGSAPELNLWHHGLGPQGARALASMLTSNRCVKWLELSDTGLCGAGAQVLACVLSRSSSIYVDLSENQPGVVGAQAVCAALTVTPAMQRVQLAGNGLEEQAAQYLAELLLAHMGLKPLDLSYSQLSDQSGWALGPALAENTGLTELEMSWSHVRGPGATAFARGLEANIFLRVLDSSFNGLGHSGASEVSEALKINNVLEELSMR